MLTVSNYHYIRETFQAPYPSIFGVTPQMFMEQLLLLKSKGDFVSGEQLLLHGDEILNSKFNYHLITFDDGLKEQYQYALPILDQLQIPVVLFANSRNYEDKKVSTVHKIHLLRSIISPVDFLKAIAKFSPITFTENDKKEAQETYIYDDKDSAVLKFVLNFRMDFRVQEEIIKSIFDTYFDENEILETLYLNKKELIELGKNHFLGSHTHNHYPIGLLEKKEMEFELQNSKHYFENLTNSKIEMVAYPYGTPEACTKEVGRTAQEVGFKLGFTTTRGVNTIENDCLLLNRFDCNDLPGGKNYREV